MQAKLRHRVSICIWLLARPHESKNFDDIFPERLSLPVLLKDLFIKKKQLQTNYFPPSLVPSIYNDQLVYCNGVMAS